MKRRDLIVYASVGAIVTLCSATDALADIPVFDGAALAQAITQVADDAKAYALQLSQYVMQAKQWATENLSWLQQVQQYTLQGEQYVNELQLFMNFYHNPSLGAAFGLLSAAGLTNGLPINPYAMMGLVNGLEYGNGGLGELSGLLGSISGLAGSAWSAVHVYTPTDGSWASQQLVARANGIAGEQGATQQTYQDLRAHAAALQSLRADLASATDTKSVLDITGEINLETTWTQNEAAQLQAITGTYAAQSDSVVQRENERLDCDIEEFINRTTGLCPSAVGGGNLLASPTSPTSGDNNLPVPPSPPAGGDTTTIATLTNPTTTPTSTDPLPTPPLSPLETWLSTPTPAPMNLTGTPSTPPLSLTDVPNIAPGVPAPPGTYDNVIDPPLDIITPGTATQ